jgi:putative oxidoreductase
MKKLLGTIDSFGPTFLRLAVGGVMIVHGLQKTAGLFGGAGFNGTMKMFTEGMHIPYAFALAAIVSESLGSLCLILGFLTRFWAICLAIMISFAVYKVHWVNGFFMNWTGKQKGEGFEFHILVFGMALALLILGAGKLSLDSALSGSSGKKSKPDKIKA